MIFGGYGKGKEELPRVFQIAIARFNRGLPDPGQPLPDPLPLRRASFAQRL